MQRLLPDPGPVTIEEQLDAYRPELKSSPDARATARFLLLTPPLPLAARPGYAALAGAAVALLPGWARRPLRLPHLPITEHLVNLPIGATATSPRPATPCPAESDSSKMTARAVGYAG